MAKAKKGEGTGSPESAFSRKRRKEIAASLLPDWSIEDLRLPSFLVSNEAMVPVTPNVLFSTEGKQEKPMSAGFLWYEEEDNPLTIGTMNALLEDEEKVFVVPKGDWFEVRSLPLDEIGDEELAKIMETTRELVQKVQALFRRTFPFFAPFLDALTLTVTHDPRKCYSASVSYSLEFSVSTWFVHGILAYYLRQIQNPESEEERAKAMTQVYRVLSLILLHEAQHMFFRHPEIAYRMGIGIIDDKEEEPQDEHEKRLREIRRRILSEIDREFYGIGADVEVNESIIGMFAHHPKRDEMVKELVEAGFTRDTLQKIVDWEPLPPGKESGVTYYLWLRKSMKDKKLNKHLENSPFGLLLGKQKLDELASALGKDDGTNEGGASISSYTFEREDLTPMGKAVLEGVLRRRKEGSKDDASAREEGKYGIDTLMEMVELISSQALRGASDDAGDNGEGTAGETGTRGERAGGIKEAGSTGERRKGAEEGTEAGTGSDDSEEDNREKKMGLPSKKGTLGREIEKKRENIRRRIAQEVLKEQEKQRSAGGKERGFDLGGMVRIAHEILQPVHDWKEELRTVVGSVLTHSIRGQDYYSYSRPDLVKTEVAKQMAKSVASARGLKSRAAMPSKRTPVFPGRVGGRVRVCVIIDTSGSVSTDLLEQAISEIRGILKAKRSVVVDVVAADYGARSHITGLRSEADLKALVDHACTEEGLVKNGKVFRLVGGGGTSMRNAVMNAIEIAKKERVAWDAMVILTDGYTDFLEKDDAESIRASRAVRGDLSERLVWGILREEEDSLSDLSSSIEVGKMIRITPSKWDALLRRTRR